MVDALVLEASTSVCGFESHLPHQKKKGTERCLFLLVPAAAGTSASLHVWQEPAVPPHTPPPFFVIPYSLRSKRTAPATGRGLEPGCAPGFFFAPNLRSRSSRSEPSRIHVAERHTKTIHSSLFSLHSPSPGLPLPLPGKAREPPSAGAEDQFPGSNTGLQNALSLRTAPPAGHRLVLNLCRRAAHQNSSLFSILSSLAQPCPFFPPGRTAKQKYILFFGHLTHNSTRYNIGLNLIMEGKEYGKTGSA